MDHQSTHEHVPADCMERFRLFVNQSMANLSSARQNRCQTKVLVLPLDGGNAGRPIYGVVTNVQGKQIHMEFPENSNPGMRFSVRLEVSANEAAWVECLTSVSAPAGVGRSVVADFQKVGCNHAAACPAFVFMTTGKLVGCSHAGHDGCHQTGPVGGEVKAMLRKASRHEGT
jgi:hypothetical protein